MTREEAINEINKVFTSAYANYIVTALTEGATASDIQRRWGQAYETGVKDGLEQAPRWIPVTEKRPVEFEKVLVTYRLHYDNSIHVGIGNIIANAVNGRYHWNINEQDYIGWDMLAWMPLPEAYKGGE